MKFGAKEVLYGDDFNLEQIEQWFKEEEEAYADLYGIDVSMEGFVNSHYSHLDSQYGFSKIPQKKYKHVLGFGASWGYEFMCFLHNIEQLTIIDSSEQTISEKLGDIKPVYVKPQSSGTINMGNDIFDLTTVFCVLHHIPNITHVLSEIVRVTQPGGYILIREPITSMELRNPSNRMKLTKNERGMPASYLQKILTENNCKIVSLSYYHFIYSFLARKFQSLGSLESSAYLKIDKILSRLFLWNFHYYPENMFQRIAPQEVYIIAQKM